MAVYTIQALKNLITDRIYDNHIRAIDGVELQELLHDILDSLASYTDASVESPAVNYYVDQVQWDLTTGALTLVRAGGIEPVNISVDLDGRYQKIADSDYRAGEESIDAGVQSISFSTPFPIGTDFLMQPVSGYNTDEGLMWALPTEKTITGFKVSFPFPVTITYKATIKK